MRGQGCSALGFVFPQCQGPSKCRARAVLEKLEAAKMGCSHLGWQVMLEKGFWKQSSVLGAVGFCEGSAGAAADTSVCSLV